MHNEIEIRPFTQPVSGEVHLPGSKSITNRALILAALSEESIVLQNALFSDDSIIMIEALQKLGFSIQTNPFQNTINIQGQGGEIPNSTATLNVGNAGTAARFLTAFLCLKEGGVYKLDGDVAMRRRPMSGLLDALEAHGATDIEYHGKPGHFPFTLKTKGYSQKGISVDASLSGQILSALLMVAPAIKKPFYVDLQKDTVSKPFIEMTLKMMEEFGGELPKLEQGGHRYAFKGTSSGYTYRQPSYTIEPDATAASYFMALPLILGGHITIHGLSSAPMKQGDIRFGYVLEPVGLNIKKLNHFWHIERVEDPLMRVPETDFNDISDTFLTLAAIAPLMKAPTLIKGIAHTRMQETDRPFAMAMELQKLGQIVDQTEDSILIKPQPLRAGTIDPYGDHRLAMSLAILGCYDLRGNGTPWLRISNPECCAKTFPNFFEVLEALREESH